MFLQDHGPIDDGLVYLLGLETKKKSKSKKVITFDGPIFKKRRPNKNRDANFNKIINSMKPLFIGQQSEYNNIPETVEKMINKYSYDYSFDELQNIYNSTQRSKTLPKGQVLSVLRDDSGILETSLGYIKGKNPLKTLGSEIETFSQDKKYELKHIINYIKSIESNFDEPFVIVPKELESLCNHTKPNKTYNSFKLILLNKTI